MSRAAAGRPRQLHENSYRRWYFLARPETTCPELDRSTMHSRFQGFDLGWMSRPYYQVKIGKRRFNTLSQRLVLICSSFREIRCADQAGYNMNWRMRPCMR